ncbi:uncharacterized protein LOC123924101 [Trifolium pratense]|uniref:uncharacterized protein LOC123924101 n=1 Tax=Trifolium pratense TaxID=57577 RepID=UPI001E697798|nr:uncharacterized protein LOC123924101 [Trifolium pratense]
MNCGVCVTGTGYGEYENDFYGQLEEIIQVEYPGLPLKRVVLFKCDWFDPTINRGTRVNTQYDIIQIHHNRHYRKYDPFIIAQKATQVYFAPHPIKTRNNANWWFIIKTKARGVIENQEICDFAYQEDFTYQNCGGVSIDLDLPINLQDIDRGFDELDGYDADGDHDKPIDEYDYENGDDDEVEMDSDEDEEFSDFNDNE